MTKKDLSGIFTIILVLVPPLVFGLRHQAAEMTVSLMAGSIAAIFWNLEKFKNFKAGGVEAELRQVVEEAHATIKQLRDIAVPLIGSGVHLLKSANRMGYGRDEREAAVADLYQATKRLGADKEEALVSQFDDFWRLQALDQFWHIQEAIRLTGKPELHSALMEFHSLCLKGGVLPKVKEVEQALQGAESVTPAIQRDLDEYTHAVEKFEKWRSN